MLTNSAISEVYSELIGKISVTVSYEDEATRDRARLLCYHLEEKLWEDFEFEFYLRRFDYLRDADNFNAAVDAAAKADLILISAHPSSELPPTVRTWIATWAARREKQDGVLVALIGMGREQDSASIHAYLSRVARRAQMDFLPPAQADQPTHRSDPPAAATGRAGGVASTLKRILDASSRPRHWGINE